MMIIKRCYKSSFYYLHKFYIIKKRKNHIPSKKLLFFLWGVYNEIVHNKIGDFMRKIRRKREKKKTENNNYNCISIFNNNDKWLCRLFNKHNISCQRKH